MSERTALVARRPVTYDGAAIAPGERFTAASEDVRWLTGGRRPYAVPARASGGPLPNDFPGLDHLTAAGIVTLPEVEKLDRRALIALPGIGEVTADRILKAARKA